MKLSIFLQQISILVTISLNKNDMRKLTTDCKPKTFVSYSMVKGIVSVISRDSLCKDGNARFTTIPLKALSDQV